MGTDLFLDAAARERTGGEALVGQLIAEGVSDLFGIPGVQLDWGVDAVRRASGLIRYYVPRHEQATSYMADGYARSTGREGVCMVVPGPGVLNALSGIATAYACNSRVLMIAGQIPSATIGRGFGMLHELPDQSGILDRMTKWRGMAHRLEEIPALVHEGFDRMRSGRPQPVAIEIPPDVLAARGRVSLMPRAIARPDAPSTTQMEQACALLAQAHLPVFVAGGGAAAAGAGAALATLAERLQAPVVMTEAGRGVLDDRHPLALPALAGRALLPRADLILAVGTRFLDARAQPIDTAPGARLIYLNLDPAAAGPPRVAGLQLLGDARVALEQIGSAVDFVSDRNAARLADKARTWANEQISQMRPQSEYVEALRESMHDQDILVSELTQVGYFANVAYPVHAPRRLLTPGYQGTLGYGFNTALGAAVGNPTARVVSINGDGGFGWGLQELATAARYRLNVSIVVFVDGRYGNVLRIQRREFGTDFATELENPDYGLLAAAHRISHSAVESPQALRDALIGACGRGGPALITVKVGEMPSPWALIHPFVLPAVMPPDDLFDGPR